MYPKLTEYTRILVKVKYIMSNLPGARVYIFKQCKL